LNIAGLEMFQVEFRKLPQESILIERVCSVAVAVQM